MSKIEKKELERAKYRSQPLGIHSIMSKKVRMNIPKKRVRTEKMTSRILSPEELKHYKAKMSALVMLKELDNPFYKINHR